MAKRTEIRVPADLEGTTAVLRNWLVKPGDAVKENDPLVELETDKVTMEIPAPTDGVLGEVLVEAGTDAAGGMLLGYLASGAAEAAGGKQGAKEAFSAERAAPSKSPDGASRLGLTGAAAEGLSPSVRRALTQHDLAPGDIDGTGKGGRITRADVEAVASGERRTLTPAAAPPPKGALKGRMIPHDTMRRKIAEHMSRSVAEAPHVTAVFEADFSAIAAHRARHKAAFEREGVKLTFTAYIVRACVEAMKVAPTVNARWHEEAIEVFDAVNIGIGTALGDKGLIVPVVHHAQDLSLRGIAMKLQDISERARANKLRPADLADGTFSISNHGVSGSLLAAPIIINQPQSAILGVGKLEKRVVVREVDGVDAIQVRPMAYVSLTIDHRVLDGLQTNAWLTRFVEVLESWPED